MKKFFVKNFCATAIGSVPHIDEKEICKKILATYTDMPFWPQMPKRAFFENMYAQFSEGLPGVVIDEAKKKIWIDTSKDLLGALEETYEKILDEDYDYFAITESRALGLYEFLRQAAGGNLGSASYIKGHVTGPISFGLSVTDEKKQAILYRPEIAEALVKILAMKARYQIRKLKKVFKNVIIFIDEPYLVSIGSSVVNIKTDDVTSKIGEVITAIHEEGALAGIHCCGNTDWSLLLGLDLDILNFDAYNFLKSISLYPEPLKNFLKNGKSIAWGIVPTSEEIKTGTEESLVKRLEDGFKLLIDKGIDKEAIVGSSIITPSCGCGTMNRKDADRVLDVNVKLSQRLKEIYGR